MRQAPSSNTENGSRRPDGQIALVELADALAIIASGTLNRSSEAFIDAKVEIIDEGNATSLVPRQQPIEVEPGVAGCNVACTLSTCGAGVCPLTKRGLGDFTSASWLNSDDSFDVNKTAVLHKRQFPDVDLENPTSIENYLQARENTDGALDVLGRTNFQAGKKCPAVSSPHEFVLRWWEIQRMNGVSPGLKDLQVIRTGLWSSTPVS